MTQTIDRLITNLGDKNFLIRKPAAEELGKLKNHISEEQFDRIVAGLKAEDWEMREGCAMALGEIGDSRAMVPLVAVISGDTPWVREIAAEALGKLNDSRAVVPLIQKLKDSTEVREAAAEALGKLKEHILPGEFRFIVNAIKDKTPNGWARKLGCITALGEIGKAKAVGPLIDELEQIVEDDFIRNSAPNLSDRLIIELMAALVKLRGHIDDHQFSRIVDGLNNGYIEYGTLLGVLDDPRAIEPILHAFGKPDYSYDGHCKELAKVLGRLKRHITDEQFKQIVDGLQKPPHHGVVAGYVRTLCEIGNSKAAEALVDHLVFKDSTLRRGTFFPLDEYCRTSKDPVFLKVLNDKLQKKISCVDNQSSKCKLFDLSSSIIKIRNELLAPAVKKLKPPKICKRLRRQKRGMWRAVQG